MCALARLIVVCLLGIVSLQSLNERREQNTACFGTGAHSLIDANCSSTENVYPLYLNAGAKLTTSACPLEMEPNATDVLVQQCCLPDTGQDCVALVNTLIPAIASDYLESCVGRQACQTRLAFRMDVLNIPTCNASAFPPQTHYLYLDYDCVPDSKIGRFPTVDLANDGSGSILHLQGSTYPFQILSTAVTCSLETDCSTNIVIYGLHVSVVCNQAIVMNDTSGTLYTIGCSDNDTVSGHRLRTLATSNDNYLEIYYTSPTTNQGLFWLAFEASGNLTLNCPRRDPINQCLTTTTEPMTTTTTTEPMTTTTTTEPMTTTTTTEPMTTTTTTTEPMTTTTTTESMSTTTEPMTTTTTTEATPPPTTTSSPSTGASSADGGSTNTIIIIVVVVVVLAIIAVVLVYFWCTRCKKKRDSKGDTEEGVDKKDNEAEQDGQLNQKHDSLSRVSAPDVTTSIPDVTTSIPDVTTSIPDVTVQPKSENARETNTSTGDDGASGNKLPPLTIDTEGIHDEMQKRKKKGRKKRKKKIQSENNEYFLTVNEVQPGASSCPTADENQNRKRKKHKKGKRRDNHISPENSCEPDDIPPQSHVVNSYEPVGMLLPNNVDKTCEPVGIPLSNNVDNSCEPVGISPSNNVDSSYEPVGMLLPNNVDNSCEPDSKSLSNNVDNSCEPDSKSPSNNVDNSCEPDSKSPSNNVDNSCEPDSKSPPNNVDNSWEPDGIISPHHVDNNATVDTQPNKKKRRKKKKKVKESKTTDEVDTGARETDEILRPDDSLLE